MNGERTPAALEYARGVHNEIRETNKDLYTRAQIVLTVDGVILAAAGGSLAAQTEDLSKTLVVFGVTTWFELAVAGGALIASILCSVKALYVRHLEGDPVPHGEAAYEPSTMWFYRHVAELEPARFIERAAQVDNAFETRARLAQVAAMAKIMVKRARWLNLAFASTGVAFIAYAVATADYLIRLSA